MQERENDYNPRNYSGPLMQPPITQEFHLRTAMNDHLADIDLGGVILNVDRRYNWLNRKLMGLLFGWRVTNRG